MHLYTFEERIENNCIFNSESETDSDHVYDIILEGDTVVGGGYDEDDEDTN